MFYFLQSSQAILRAFGSGSKGGPRSGADPVVTYIVLGSIVLLLAIVVLVNSRKGGSGTGNLRKLAKAHGLDRDQVRILKKAIKDYKITNVEMLFSNPKFFNSILRKLLRSADGLQLPPADKESLKGEFFEIKRLISTHHVPPGAALASTKNIPANQEVRVLTKQFPPFNTVVSGKTSDFLVVDHPRDGHGDLIGYQEGSLVKVRFIRDADRVYTFVSTITAMREFEGEPKLLIAHTSKVQRVQMRRNPRKDYNRSAFFYNVRISTEGKGRKAVNRAMVDRNRRYAGSFMDISAGGCALITRSPLPKGSALMLHFDFEHDDGLEIFARVRGVQKQRNGTALMHLSFTKVPQRVQNAINAFVYDLQDDDASRRSILNRTLVD